MQTRRRQLYPDKAESVISRREEEKIVSLYVTAPLGFGNYTDKDF